MDTYPPTISFAYFPAHRSLHPTAAHLTLMKILGFGKRLYSISNGLSQRNLTSVRLKISILNFGYVYGVLYTKF